jgi:hypothetical protein
MIALPQGLALVGFLQCLMKGSSTIAFDAHLTGAKMDG